jgi:hypothetical protein
MARLCSKRGPSSHLRAKKYHFEVQFKKKKQFLAKHEVFVHFSSVFSRNLPRAPTTSGPHQRAWLALDQAAVEVCLHPAISGKSYAAILAIES